MLALSFFELIFQFLLSNHSYLIIVPFPTFFLHRERGSVRMCACVRVCELYQWSISYAFFEQSYETPQNLGGSKIESEEARRIKSPSRAFDLSLLISIVLGSRQACFSRRARFPSNLLPLILSFLILCFSLFLFRVVIKKLRSIDGGKKGHLTNR